MGGQSNTQQPVFYDADMGQYYTQPQGDIGQSMFSMLNYGLPNSGIGNKYTQMTGKQLVGGRNYLNGFGQYSPALQQTAPYEYADVSLESLFPMLQGALQGSQGGAMEGGAGLLGSQGATGQASSGAGRFM